MLRVGLVGCGFISEKHLKTMSRLNELSLVAVSDIRQERMEKVVRHYQSLDKQMTISRYTDYHDLLEARNIDIVIISVVSGLHAEIAIKALQQGKHVIVEKPLALSLQDTNRIIDLAEKHHKKVLVCHQLRYKPMLQKLQELLQQGYFGAPYFGMVSLHLNRSSDYFASAAWKGTWKKDGGMLINQGIHMIDLLVWLMGDVESVYGEIATNEKNKEIEDVATGIITFKNHAKGLIEANTITKPRNLGYSLSIFARKGTICLGGQGLNEIEHCYHEDYAHLERDLLSLSKDSDEHYRMYQDFLKAIKEDSQHLMTPEEGKKALETIFALYHANNNQKPTILPMDDFSTKEMRKV